MQTNIDISSLYKIQYGMYIITSKLGDKINGQIATTVMQVTNSPIQLSVCLSNKTLTHEMIMQSKVFGVSILRQETPMVFIGRFGFKCGRDTEKCKGVNYEQNLTGCPLVIENSLATMEAQVQQTVNLDSHTLFIGTLLSAKNIDNGTALTYEYYHSIIKGKSPENAPTHMIYKSK